MARPHPFTAATTHRGPLHVAEGNSIMTARRSAPMDRFHPHHRRQRHVTMARLHLHHRSHRRSHNCASSTRLHHRSPTVAQFHHRSQRSVMTARSPHRGRDYLVPGVLQCGLRTRVTHSRRHKRRRTLRLRYHDRTIAGWTVPGISSLLHHHRCNTRLRQTAAPPIAVTIRAFTWRWCTFNVVPHSTKKAPNAASYTRSLLNDRREKEIPRHR